MRKVSITVDGDLLRAIDRAGKALVPKSSQDVRQALRARLQKKSVT